MFHPVPATEPPIILKLLAHEVRWGLVSALVHSDYRVHELVTLLQKPMNLVSYHLRQLREGALVREHRSTADGRDVYYTLDLAQLQQRYLTAAAALHPSLGGADPPAHDQAAVEPPARVLFLCTHNSARSQIAEALLRQMAGPQVAVFSAGTEPSVVHPLALQVLGEQGIDATVQRSTHLETFQGQPFDYIITVCDRAREVCPIFPGDPVQIHWSFADPTAIASPLAQEQAFQQLLVELQTRLRYLLVMIERARRGR